MPTETNAMLLEILKFEEGFSATPYPDAGGYSIGYGYHLDSHGLHQRDYAGGITRDQAEDFLLDAVAESIDKAQAGFPAFRDFAPVRKVAIVSMSYQIGGFPGRWRETPRLINAGKWDDAAIEALHSKWARQTSARALRTAYALGTADLPELWRVAVEDAA